MAEVDYKLDAVKATRVASEDIDRTFRSGCIGRLTSVMWLQYHVVLTLLRSDVGNIGWKDFGFLRSMVRRSIKPDQSGASNQAAGQDGIQRSLV